MSLETRITSTRGPRLPQDPGEESEARTVNHFTPERLVRLQDRSDERKFLAALDEWEHALASYQEQLTRIRSELPGDLPQLLDTVSLHDARVLDMWWGGRSQCTITLHTEADPARLVVLTYSLAGPPEVHPDVLPEAVRSRPVSWLYDELDFAGAGQPGGPAFVHSILLSDGREVRLLFRNVTVKRPVPLVPDVHAEGTRTNSIRHSA